MIPFAPFAVLGAMLVMALAVIWLCVALRTAVGAYRGSLFAVPRLIREDYAI